jgi:hypothetical protein
VAPEGHIEKGGKRGKERYGGICGERQREIWIEGIIRGIWGREIGRGGIESE